MWLGTLRVEPLFRQRVVEVYLGDGALLSCRQFSRPCSVEQRDARACAAHVAGAECSVSGGSQVVVHAN